MILKTSFITGILAVALPTFFAAAPAQASTCSTSSVWASSVTPLAGGANVLSGNVDATACAGAYVGNDIPFPGTKGGANLGYYGDGLVNGAAQTQTGSVLFPNGMFSELYPTQFLNPNSDGVHADPGWIYAGSSNGTSFTGALIGNTLKVSDSTFNFNLNANGTGTWGITPDLQNALALASLLKGNALDQFAIVVKYGNGFQAFDFTAKSLGLPLTNPPTLYNFSGGFDLSTYLTAPGGGFSHIDLYFRDPILGTSIPEPGSLALLGLGFAALGFFNRRKKI